MIQHNTAYIAINRLGTIAATGMLGCTLFSGCVNAHQHIGEPAVNVNVAYFIYGLTTTYENKRNWRKHIIIQYRRASRVGWVDVISCCQVCWV